MSRLSVCLLGAVNGLLFGAVVEMLRRAYTPIYLERVIRRAISATPPGMNPPYSFTCIGDESFVLACGIPLLCALIFAAVALLIHAFWNGRIRSVLLLWQVIGVASMTLAVIMHDLLSPICHHTYLLPLMWRWILCLPIIMAINLAYGLIIVTSAAYYMRMKDARLR